MTWLLLAISLIPLSLTPVSFSPWSSENIASSFQPQSFNASGFICPEVLALPWFHTFLLLSLFRSELKGLPFMDAFSSLYLRVDGWISFSLSSEKNCAEKLNRQRRLVQDYCNKGERLNSIETKSREVFKFWGELMDSFWRKFGEKGCQASCVHWWS